MRSIRSKLIITTLLSILVTAGLTYQIYSSYNSTKSIQLQTIQLEKIKGNLTAIANSPFYKNLYKKIKKDKNRLYPAYRNKVYNKILKAYQDKNRDRLNKEITLFRKQDLRYLKYLKSNTRAHEERIQSYLIGIAANFLVTLVILLFITFRLTLRPIKKLSQRMLDFLNNRYSYQFSVPKKNEVGELELNFHSLAQRVLNNIEELKALDSAKSDFLNIASHELRTPLTSIKGSLSLLKTGITTLPPEKVTQLVGIAETETDRLIRLINDLLDLAKIEAGKLPLEKDWVSIDSVIEKTLYSLDGLSRSSGVKLTYTSGQCKKVDIDQDKVQQVITNLVSNAIKYSPENGSVNVKVLIDHSNHLRIEIKDQGKGISPEDQKLIFEKFRQASGPQNPIVKGTGLGLAIAKAVIEEHNGVMGVQSKLGEGSTFFFTLPDWKQDEVTIDFNQDDPLDNPEGKVA